MNDSVKGILAAVLVIGGLLAGIYVSNRYDFFARKIDDATNYDTLKEVEDTCRAMITSYTADKLRYETYAASESPERQEWAEQAKIRANSTAAKYNEYYLKNSFVWKGGVPTDIKSELPYLT